MSRSNLKHGPRQKRNYLVVFCMGCFQATSTLCSVSYYKKAHNWIRKNKPLPRGCEQCGKKRPLDYANISGNCLLDVSDWRCLCRRCHAEFDNHGVMWTRKFVRYDYLVTKYIEEYPQEALRRLSKEHVYWKKPKDKARMVIEYLTSDDTFKQVGYRRGVTTSWVRDVVHEGVRVLSRQWNIPEIQHLRIIKPPKKIFNIDRRTKLYRESLKPMSGANCAVRAYGG